MATVESDDRFYVGPSTIPGAGEGLFASVALDRGDRLRIVGILIPRESMSDRCTSFVDAYKIRVGDDLLIPTGWCAKVNHRDPANVRKVVEGGEAWLEALCPIAQDEEIFFRYDEYAQNRFGPFAP